MIKKKISELTLKDIINICEHTHCLNCPLHINCTDECTMDYFNSLRDDELDREVEVEE